MPGLARSGNRALSIWPAATIQNFTPARPVKTRNWLADLSEPVERLPDVMQRRRVDEGIIQRLTDWIDGVSAGLAEARPRSWR
ncbi:MAG: hypothetical protein ACQEQ7_12705 [Thermodesulfobacteriota bacterium]